MEPFRVNVRLMVNVYELLASFFALSMIQISAFSIRDLNKISFHLLINRSFILHFYIVPTVLTLSCTQKHMLCFVISLICQRRKVQSNCKDKISLYTDVVLFFFSFFPKNRRAPFYFLLPPPLSPCAGGQ